jgi:threonine/homoserine/homoserine lactone efflux protein
LLPAELWLFAGAVCVLNATPGVDFLLTVTRTLQGGARAGIAAVAGISAGCVLHALAAAFGLAALLALRPGAFRLIQWAGGACLVWLGIGMLRQAWRRGDPLVLPPDGPAPPRHWLADLRTGLLTNLLNPKVALFFLAFLPQFVPADSPSPTASFLLLGAWFVLQGGLFSLALVTLAARLAQVGTRPALRRCLNGVGGLLFMVLALRLLRERPVAV